MLGSTGERLHLDESEYLRTIEAAREAVPPGAEGLAFIVGVGQQSTRGTINEVKLAARARADAVLMITPHFYRSAITPEALIAHYTAVADSSPVPVILYSMPALTGIKIEPETVARLSEHQNIVGIKDSSADIEGLKRTVDLVRGHSSDSSINKSSPVESIRDGSPAHSSTPSATPGDFVILTGNGTVLYEALRAGADGAILAVGCLVPDLCLEIFRAVNAGENERAAVLQEKLTPLAHAVTTRHGIGGLKAALDRIGYVGGAVRAPLRSPDEAARGEIARQLEDARLATAGSTLKAVQA